VPTAPAITIADIVIPDTPLVRDVTALIRDAEDDLLFHHSRRVFLFGALQGRRRGLQPDLELLYVGAMFHDIGLTEAYGIHDWRRDTAVTGTSIEVELEARDWALFVCCPIVDGRFEVGDTSKYVTVASPTTR